MSTTKKDEDVVIFGENRLNRVLAKKVTLGQVAFVGGIAAGVTTLVLIRRGNLQITFSLAAKTQGIMKP